MIPALCVTLTILLQLILSYTAVSPLKAEISPKKPLFRVGDRQELTCRMRECSGKMTFIWGGLQDKPLYAESQTSSNESTLIFKSVDKNENEIQCKATCRGITKQDRASVRVYCPLVNTVISVSPHNPKEKEFMNISCVSDSNPTSHLVLSKVLDGKETELVSGDGPRVSVSYHKAKISHSGVYVCTTTHVCGRQTDNVTITVGNELVHKQEGEHGTQTIQSHYTFTPQTTDKGKSLTCRATLRLDGLPLEDRSRETTVSLSVISPTASTKDTAMKPSDLFQKLNSFEVIIPVIGLGVLALVAILLTCVRKVSRKGWFGLTKDTAETV